MKLSDLVVPESIVSSIATVSREEAVARIVESLARVREIVVPDALKDVVRRERLGSTLIPVGERNVAIPHATTQACRQLVVGVGISPDGVPWIEPHGTRAHLIFLLLGPAPTRSLYVRLLSRIARLCEREEFVEELVRANAPQELTARLAMAEEPLGPIRQAEDMPTFCVLGAGDGGLAMAGHLAILGCKVNLFNRTEQRIEAVKARGGIDVTGAVEGFGGLNCVSSDPADAIDEADVLMVVVPATGHRSMAEIIAPHVKDGQIIILNPGRTGGALEVARVLKELNPQARPYIAEAQTLLYASRVTNPGQVRIFGIKNSVPLSTLPAHHVADVLPVVRGVLPQFVPGDNVLKTSMDNIGAIFHPAITILNAARIEDTHGDFEYYVEGVTPAVAAILEKMDEERVQVAAALGIRANTAREWLYLAYDAAGKTLLEAMRANHGYEGIQAPPTVQHRYISEDVPTSLVPMASLGEMLQVPTPTIRAMITLASVMHGVDYWAEGRTVEKLGLQGMSLKEIRFLVVGATP